MHTASLHLLKDKLSGPVRTCSGDQMAVLAGESHCILLLCVCVCCHQEHSWQSGTHQGPPYRPRHLFPTPSTELGPEGAVRFRIRRGESTERMGTQLRPPANQALGPKPVCTRVQSCGLRGLPTATGGLLEPRLDRRAYTACSGPQAGKER